MYVAIIYSDSADSHPVRQSPHYLLDSLAHHVRVADINLEKFVTFSGRSNLRLRDQEAQVQK